jgi:hypothetical protein
VKSSQTAKLFGLIGQSPLPERSARNWQAARWRLRLLVEVNQLLREIISDCQTLRPNWTVAATGTLWPKIVTYLLNLHRRYRFDWMILFRFDDLS